MQETKIKVVLAGEVVLFFKDTEGNRNQLEDWSIRQDHDIIRLDKTILNTTYIMYYKTVKAQYYQDMITGYI